VTKKGEIRIGNFKNIRRIAEENVWRCIYLHSIILQGLKFRRLGVGFSLQTLWFLPMLVHIGLRRKGYSGRYLCESPLHQSSIVLLHIRPWTVRWTHSASLLYRSPFSLGLLNFEGYGKMKLIFPPKLLGFKLCPSSGILETGKHNVSET
jgi:hypothetical protein